MSELMLDVGTANDLKMAFRRAGWLPEDIAKFCAGDCAARVLPIVRSQKLVTVTRLWTEQDGVITFSVTSDGTTGEEWITRLECKGMVVIDHAESLLRSKAFKPTTGITTQICVFKGSLFRDNERVTKQIRVEAKKRGFTKPNAEVACLIRERFTNQELEAMGLDMIVAMHEPIKDSTGHSYLLCADRSHDVPLLHTSYCDPGPCWYVTDGFAFAAAPTA